MHLWCRTRTAQQQNEHDAIEEQTSGKKDEKRKGKENEKEKKRKGKGKENENERSKRANSASKCGMICLLMSSL